MSGNTEALLDNAGESLAGDPRHLTDLRDCSEPLLRLLEAQPALQREDLLLRQGAGMSLPEIAAAPETAAETAQGSPALRHGLAACGPARSMPGGQETWLMTKRHA